MLGAPNSGKSTLFNKLAGATRRVGNYPGVTQSVAHGRLADSGGASGATSAAASVDAPAVELVDCPGIYRLFGGHGEQALVQELLAADPPPDALLVALCAEQLGAQLPLVFDLQRLQLPMLVAVTMDDLHEGQGLDVDLGALAEGLGCQVVSSSTVRDGGLVAARAALRRLGAAVGSGLPGGAQDAGAGNGAGGEARGAGAGNGAGGASAVEDLRARLRQLGDTIAASPMAAAADDLAGRVLRRRRPAAQGLSLLDRVLLHPLGGSVAIFLTLAVAFQLVFEASGPPSEWVAGVFDGLAAAMPASWQENPLGAFAAQGLLPGLGAVLTLLPPILAVSLLMQILEQTGVLSRIALLCDGLLRRLGMGGYGLFPMLTGLSCALPAITASRAIPSAPARWVCMAAIPLVPCSARVPVYALVITAFVPHGGPLGGALSYKGLALFALYAMGLASALVAAGVAGSYLRAQAPQMPIELPGGKGGLGAHAGELLRGLWQRAQSYLFRAGPLILLASVALWALAAIPAPFAPQDSGGELRHSMVGALGSLLHPLVAPLGFSWELSVALVPGLWAREVVVGALASIYAVQGAGQEGALATLLSARWSFAQGMALAVWYVYAPQCLATFTFMTVEARSGRFAWLLFAAYLALAWVMAFLAYNLLSLL